LGSSGRTVAVGTCTREKCQRLGPDAALCSLWTTATECVFTKSHSRNLLRACVPAVYLPTGVGSMMEKMVVTNIVNHRVPKETREFNGKKYILEYALQPDFAFVHAFKGDTEGNLRYSKTARNFNPVMAAAAKCTIAEVENVVEPGQIDGDDVHTPGLYVKRIVPVPRISFAVTID